MPAPGGLADPARSEKPDERDRHAPPRERGTARAYRAEQRARADLEALVETSPVGVVVLDAATGRAVPVNREARRIVETLHAPDRPPEELLSTLTARRADGREIALPKYPIAQALGSGETVRAEEIVLSTPDGRSVTTLVNATPIPSQDGAVVEIVDTEIGGRLLDSAQKITAIMTGNTIDYAERWLIVVATALGTKPLRRR